MNEQEFQVLVVKHLAGELSAGESERVLDEVKVSVERQKFFEDCSRVWKQTETISDLPPIEDLDEKWKRFQQVAFVEAETVSLFDRYKVMWRLAAAVILLISGALVLNLFNKKMSPGIEYVAIQSNDLLRSVTLPDGSLVHLDKGSEVRYEQSFTSREIQLEGKALFEVEHLPDDDPFVVMTQNTQTTVLGTIFMVNAVEEKEVQVFVKEGRVSFQPTEIISQMEILEAGDEAVFRSGTGVIDKREQVVESNLLSWKTGEFKFDDAPLAEILPLIEHYYGVSFEVKNKTLLKCTYNTDFSNVNLQDILDELSFGLNLEISEMANSHYEIDGITCN